LRSSSCTDPIEGNQWVAQSNNCFLRIVIAAKPKTGTLVSFGVFLLISYSLLGLSIYVLVHDPYPPVYHYFILTLLTPVALYITYKVFIRYKTVAMHNRQIEVHYPHLRRHRTYPLEEVASWTESTVKTGKSSTYKELEVNFTDGRKIQMGYREFSEYEKMVQYLAQKLPGLRK
jgi:hypothetical protein